ncbi:MAG: DNA topoisomerase (ATP-hydrolyzing) subunit A [Mycoplasmoidaceae bacterium]
MSKRDNDSIEKIKESLTETRINDISIVNELENSFLDYAMSVIISRALPDIRDGLKPVHRRILYAAYKLGMTHDKPYKKSARLVGEVIGKYHPHGDNAVYEATVRMAQDFSLRYPLVDGHGNFGSIDGDSAAAMRYTEARLSKISAELLDNIEKDTIDFVENYDGSELEPSVLPAAFPNLLVNGSTGIAVGMSTVIPPHNISEVIDAAIFVAKNENASIEEIKEYIKGPDFPTYGEIVGEKGINDYFHTGRGSITVRSKYEIEELPNGKSAIIINELPYMVNKSNLIEKIVRLVRDEVITSISDLRDETSREGIRIVIETKRDVIPEILLNKIFKMTDLQTNVSVNFIALVNGAPKQLNIKEALVHYLSHQIEVLIRKSNFELKKAKAREHLLEGLLIAINNIEEVIKIIRNSASNEIAEEKLISKFKLSKDQSKAILDMRLRSLSSLEINKIEEELKTLKVLIADLNSILNSKARQIEVISNNMLRIKEKFGDKRRTEILYGVSSDIKDEDLIPKENIVITMSENGYLKRIPIDTYRTQNRGGVGVKGLSTHSDDGVKLILNTNTHIDLLFFSDKGKAYRIRAHEIPIGSRQGKGLPALNLINIEKTERILTILPIDNYDESHLFFVTLNGVIKRTKLEDFSSIRSNGKIALSLKDNDILKYVFKTNGNEEIFIGSTSGHLVRFNEKDARVMGRTAAGVRGIRLMPDHHVTGASSSSLGGLVLSIGENGFGKLSEIPTYRLTKRGSKGVISLKITNKTGKMIFNNIVKGDEDLLMLTSSGKINRISLAKIRVIGRSTSGVKMINLEDNQTLLSGSVFGKED